MSMTFFDSTLAGVCSLVTDGTHDTPKSVETGFPLIKAKEIVGGQIDFATCEQISRDDHQKVISRSKPEHGDTLFAHIGASLGEAAFVNTRREFSIKNIALFKPNPSVINERYLYYCVISPNFQDRIKAMRTGAAQPFLGLAQLRGFSIRIHRDTGTQHRIASILSAYDDLIENNSRRIVILEEMARRLYEEWFIHFRFPGHEQVRMVESELGLIPEGWEIAKLGDHLIALESGKRPKGGIVSLESGIPSIGAENINGIGKHNFSSEKLVTEEFFSQMRKGVVQDGDVALYKDGAYIGRSSYFRDGFPHTLCSVNEHVFLLRSDGIRLKQNFLYLWLQQEDIVSAIRSTNANAAQPGINQQTVGGLELLIPDLGSSAKFDALVEPMLAAIINYAKKNTNLRAQRDLLLPKLISGEIEVSTFPEPEAVAA